LVFFVFALRVIVEPMRDAVFRATEASKDASLLTTGEAARLLGASRQHVVDLCERGDIPFVTVGKHRRVRRSDVEALRERAERMTREQLRSLWLGHAIAGRFVENPGQIRDLALTNVREMRRKHRGQVKRWLDEWAVLLEGPVEKVLEALTSRTPRARELRQNSPFAGVLTDDERRRLLSQFREAKHLKSTRPR
jgi:excisionase family DNA binding protein